MLVRTSDPMGASMSLKLSEPGPAEECSITMEAIGTYRPPFMPPSFAHAHVIKNQPTLTKATLPCGHSFDAMAVVYHFMKNSMTCPCCRAGIAGARMAEQSIPPHMRRAFAQHMAHSRREEEREQIAADAMAATRLLHHEVSYDFMFLTETRLVISLAAFQSLNSESSREPTMVLELPLTSSLTMGMVESACFGYCLHQINLNLRLLPMAIRAFELSIGMSSMHRHEWASICLFRTVRFAVEEDPASTRITSHLIASADQNPALNLEVYMYPPLSLARSNPQFARIAWKVSAQTFTDLLINTSQNMTETASV